MQLQCRLRLQEGVFAKVFGYGIAGDEDKSVGVSYILMEEMAGNPWNLQGPQGKRSADDKDKRKCGMGQVIFWLSSVAIHFPGQGLFSRALHLRTRSFLLVRVGGFLF